MRFRLPRGSRLPAVLDDLTHHFETHGLPRASVTFHANPHGDEHPPVVSFGFSDQFVSRDDPKSRLRYGFTFDYASHAQIPVFNLYLQVDQLKPDIRSVLSIRHSHSSKMPVRPIQETQYAYRSAGLIARILHGSATKAHAVNLEVPAGLEPRFYSFLSQVFGKRSHFESAQVVQSTRLPNAEVQAAASKAIVDWLRSHE